MKQIGPVFARDGDNVVIKTSLLAGETPLNIVWSRSGEPVDWSARVRPYNRPGCVGISISAVCPQDEGHYTCRVSNSQGEDSFSSTLLVDCKSCWCL